MRRRFRSRIALIASVIMLVGFSLPASVVGQQTEKSMTGQITVTVGSDCLGVSSPGGQTWDVVNNWVITARVFHSNWTQMNSSGFGGGSVPNITVHLWMNYSGGTAGSAYSNNTHYAFAIQTNDTSLGKAAATNGWYEVGPDAASDVHLVSVTNASNISKTVVGNDPVEVLYNITIRLNPDARYANSTGSVTGAWFLAVRMQDNASNADYYDNTTAHYNQYYGHVNVNDSTWSVTMLRGSAIRNESESAHRVTYTVNFESDLRGSGDIFNHSLGYAANQYIMPDNISMALCTGASIVLSSTPHNAGGWVNLTWASLAVSWNSTIDMRHRVDLSGMAVPTDLVGGVYSGNTYLGLRQH